MSAHNGLDLEQWHTQALIRLKLIDTLNCDKKKNTTWFYFITIKTIEFNVLRMSKSEILFGLFSKRNCNPSLAFITKIMWLRHIVWDEFLKLKKDWL